MTAVRIRPRCSCSWVFCGVENGRFWALYTLGCAVMLGLAGS